MGGVCVVAMATFLLTCPIPGKPPIAGAAKASAKSASALKVVNGSFLLQMTAFIVLLAAVGASSALLPFLVRDMNVSADIVGIAMLVNILVALLASLVWPIVIRRFGLRAAWQLAAAATCLGPLAVVTAPGADLQFYLGMAISGAGLSGMQIAGFIGLADLTAEQIDGGRGSGLVTGIWMAGEKAGLASGPLLAGFGLKFMGLTVFGSAARSSMATIPTMLAILSIVIITFAFQAPSSQSLRSHRVVKRNS
jgi:glycoside/pentoside/hexuronide:cation symporter, GPH family